jgi:hypothetical protein
VRCPRRIAFGITVGIVRLILPSDTAASSFLTNAFQQSAKADFVLL